MKKQEINLIKSFMAIQHSLSNEKQILCNKYHDLELSHNRKIRALTKIEQICINCKYTQSEVLNKIQELCKEALFCNGRVYTNYYSAFKDLLEKKSKRKK